MESWEELPFRGSSPTPFLNKSLLFTTQVLLLGAGSSPCLLTLWRPSTQKTWFCGTGARTLNRSEIAKNGEGRRASMYTFVWESDRWT